MRLFFSAFAAFFCIIWGVAYASLFDCSVLLAHQKQEIQRETSGNPSIPPSVQEEMEHEHITPSREVKHKRKKKHNKADSVINIALFIPFRLKDIYNDDNRPIDTINTDYSDDAWDFYVGSKIALDSLMNTPLLSEGKPIAVHYHDAQPIQSIEQLDTLWQEEGYQPEMIIGFVTGSSFEALADYSKETEIPFVSAIYPSPAQHVDNPSLFVLNPPLLTHALQTLRFIKTPEVTILVKKGEYSNIVQPILNALKTEGSILEKKIHFVTLKDTAFASLNAAIPSYNVRQSTFFVLSFDADLIKNILILFNNNSSKDRIYQVAGLPFWEEMPFVKNLLPKYMTILYSQAFNYHKELPLLDKVKRIYEYYYFTPFSSMVGLGFESIFHLLPLYLHHPSRTEFRVHMNDSTDKVFDNFHFSFVDSYFGQNVESVPFTERCMVNQKVFFHYLKNRRTSHIE